MNRYVVVLALVAATPTFVVPESSEAATAWRPIPFPRGTPRPLGPRHVGLGKLLSTSDGGQIFGFDIDRSGGDGILASAQTVSPKGDVLVSVQTFDQDTGKITKTFAKYRGKRNEYEVDGISVGDVGLVKHFVTPKGSIYPTRHYELMNPVRAEKFTGVWTPPIDDFDVLTSAENQATNSNVLFGIELKNQDQPDLVVSDIAANTFGNVIHLDPNLFGGGNGPQFGQWTAANKAVFALSPDGGRVGGSAPLNVIVDLKTGKQVSFNGLNGGSYGAGYVNGMAVDPNTGISATTTELNAQVEFYNLAKLSGIAVQLPCSTNVDQLLSGSGVTVDPVNKLFLVTEQYRCSSNGGSVILAYDETGRLVETIRGFKFFVGEPPVAINPSKRMGWAFGPNVDTLQQFFY